MTPARTGQESTARPAPSHRAYLDTHHFASLDGLRFICIAAVLWHHGLVWPDLYKSSGLFGRGYVGVDFFFVLSGFLITTLLLRERAEKGRFDLRAFYWRRVLRIVPVYYLVVTVAGLYAVLRGDGAQAAELLPYYYLFLSNFLIGDVTFLTVTWSLSMEEQYYLIWPLLLLLLPPRWLVPALVCLVALNLAAVLGALTPLGIRSMTMGPLLFKMPWTTYSPLLMGSLAAILLHRQAWFDRIAPLLAPRPVPWLLFVALGGLLAAHASPLTGWPNLLMHSLMTLILMSLVVREDNGMRGLLTLKPIARIGQISYGIYLYHLFALGAVLALFDPPDRTEKIVITIVYPFLAILIAEVSFRTFETWFLRLRRKAQERV